MATYSEYWNLLVAIKTQIEQNYLSGLDPVPLVVVEQAFKAEQSWIGIYMDRRDAPPEYQNLQNGKRTKFLCRIPIWCWRYAVDPDQATRGMLEMVQRVEAATMIDRTFGGTCIMSWMEGGQLSSQLVSETNGTVTFVGGETVLIADVQVQGD